MKSTFCFTSILVAAFLLVGITAQAAVVFSDNFDVSTFNTDIDFEYDLGTRQSGTIGPLTYWEMGGPAGHPNPEYFTWRECFYINGYEDALTLISNSMSPWAMASPDYNFFGMTDYEIEFDVDPIAPWSDNPLGTGCAGLTFGGPGPGEYPSQTPTGMGFFLYGDGTFRLFGPRVGAEPDVIKEVALGQKEGYYRVKIAINQPGPGQDAMVSVFVDGVNIVSSYRRVGGFIGQYLTFTALSLDDVNNMFAFDNFKVIDKSLSEPSESRPKTVSYSDSITIDGSLSDWADAEWTPLDQIYEGAPSDIAEAYYALKWGAGGNKVYVAAKVRDSAPFFTDSYTNYNSLKDCLELYLHTTGDGPLDYSLSQADAQQYVIGIKGIDNNSVWSAMGAPTRAANLPLPVRFREEGVRVAHLAGYAGSEEVMGDLGCNMAMLNTWSLLGVQKTTAPDSEQVVVDGDLSRLKGQCAQQAYACRRADMASFVTIYGLAEEEARLLSQHQYRFFVKENGSTGTVTPCPLERRYWIGLILPQFLVQAKTLVATGVKGGAIIDTEMYAAGDSYPFWWSQDICYCDVCWDAYWHYINRPDIASLPKTSRGAWVDNNGRDAEYHNLMEDRLAALMAEMATECREINPGFMLGFYPYLPNWVCHAMLRGWSTPEIPTLAMSYTEFHQGFWSRSEEYLAALRATGTNALYVGGVMQGKFYPVDYATELEELVNRADGYWMYYSAMFFNPLTPIKPPEQGSEYTLTAPADEYFTALAAANARLDQQISPVPPVGSPGAAGFIADGSTEVIGGGPARWLYYEAALTPYEFFDLSGAGNVISTLQAGNVIGFDAVAVGNDGSAFTGMVAENTMRGKFNDYTRFGRHLLVMDVSVPDAKKSADGAGIACTGIVSAAFDDFFYIESSDRAYGIRVSKSDHGLSVGQIVRVAGAMTTVDSGERCIAAAEVTTGGNGTIIPVGVVNKAIGGGDFGDVGAGLGQKGIAGALGLNNIGLLVRAWGRATLISGSQYSLDDGSGVQVVFDLPDGADAPADGAYVAATGISSCESDGSGNLSRLLLPRDANDVTVFTP